MLAILTTIVEALARLFAALLLLTIMSSGIVMMIKPEKGREILKNAAIAAGLFIVGLYLAQACLQGLR